MFRRMQAFAKRGYLAVSIDVRYHGSRQITKLDYQEALIQAWKDGKTRPFLLDTVYDLIRLLDHLEGRPDVDASRIGMTGISLGGMLTWLTAVCDERIAVTVPMIGVQNFEWAIHNNKWHDRVATISAVFNEAASSMGRPSVDSQ
eukprot:gene20903-25070_t